MLNKQQKIMIIGGGGLIGSCVTKKLLEQGFHNIAIVTMNDEASMKRIHDMNKYFPSQQIRVDIKNIFVSEELTNDFFQTIIKDAKKIRKLYEYIKNDLEISIKQSSIYKVVKEFNPEIIIDGVNSSNIFSKLSAQGLVQQGEPYDLGIELMIKHYQHLTKILNPKFWVKESEEIRIEQYLKLGTTGVGGMGLDIPFTHGDEKPSKKLLRKISFAGSESMLLYALSNNKNTKTKIKEIKPATSVFNMKLNYLEPKKTSIKIFEKRLNNKVSRKNLLKNSVFSCTNNISGFYLDGGESGPYSVEEFRLLTSNDQMGIVSTDEISEIVLNVLNDQCEKHDVMSTMKKTFVESSDKAETIRSKIFEEAGKKSKFRKIALGYLGPHRITKLLIEAELIKISFDNAQSLIDAEIEIIIEQLMCNLDNENIKENLASLGIPVIMKGNILRIYGQMIAQNDTDILDNNLTGDDLINRVARLLWIDLREENIREWKKVIKDYYSQNKKNNLFYPADIVSFIIENK